MNLCISTVILNGIRNAGCIAHTIKGTLSLEDLQNLLFYHHLNVLQFHNAANITEQVPGRFPPKHVRHLR